MIIFWIIIATALATTCIDKQCLDNVRGPRGRPGSTGSNGPAGPNGPTGTQGSTGSIAPVVCPLMTQTMWRVNQSVSIILPGFITPIPGLTSTFNLGSNAQLLISANGQLSVLSGGIGVSGANAYLFANGVQIPNRERLYRATGTVGYTRLETWALGTLFQPGVAGTYTIDVRAENAPGVSSSSFRANSTLNFILFNNCSTGG